MNTKSTVLLSLACLVFVFGSCVSLKCYDCGTLNSTCDGVMFNKNKTEYLTECESDETQCGKAVTCGSKNKTVVRGCFGPRSEKFFNSNYTAIALCQKDGCNGSLSLKYSAVVMILSTVAIRLLN